jgi:hypothetical protein
MVSAISGDSTVDDESTTPQSNPLSPPHPQAHMPTSLDSPNEFCPSLPPPIPASFTSDSSASASASTGFWSIGTLKSSLAATSSSLTEVYKVCEHILKPFSTHVLADTMILQRDILTFASSLTEEVRAHVRVSGRFLTSLGRSRQSSWTLQLLLVPLWALCLKKFLAY